MFIGVYRPGPTSVYYDTYSRLCRLRQTYWTYIDLCTTLLPMAFCHFPDVNTELFWTFQLVNCTFTGDGNTLGGNVCIRCIPCLKGIVTSASASIDLLLIRLHCLRRCVELIATWEWRWLAGCGPQVVRIHPLTASSCACIGS